MDNFIFHSPTKFIFGKGTEHTVGEEIVQLGKKKVLLHYGKDSIKKSGLYGNIVASLKKMGLEFFELAGVEANPKLDKVKDGIDFCRLHKIDIVLAVGGGSVIDSAKAIAAGVLYEGDIWELFSSNVCPSKALPVGVILTMAAAGSEGSAVSVITNYLGGDKIRIRGGCLLPKFSIMNPELTYTLPKEQTSYGSMDIISHMLERYFSPTKDVELTDRFIEQGIKNVMRNVVVALDKADDYNARAELMWTGMIAHNDSLSVGRIGDWATHNIEHQVSAEYDIAHGLGLAILFPAWMKYVYNVDRKRFIQFAVNIMDVDYNASKEEEVILEGIYRFENFIKTRMNIPVRFRDIGLNFDSKVIASKCLKAYSGKIGAFKQLSQDDIENIYNLAK